MKETIQLINIGFGNMVSAERVVAIVSPDSAPMKRLIQEARESGMLIDATYGRKTATVFIMDSDHVVLSAIALEKLAQRLGVSMEENRQGDE
jgi:extracellular matrix regulatory protein A